MILLLSIRYKKEVACLLASIFYVQLLAPVYAASHSSVSMERLAAINYRSLSPRGIERSPHYKEPSAYNRLSKTSVANYANASQVHTSGEAYIGGPSSPEATSFKAIGSSNLVSLFTGDFSYSIPLMDVGGYPVNLFYNAGISMEQEASWVGTGWNINPGSVSRNMRGVPDDFDGTDMLTQTQKVKPNKTWGGEVGVDAELLGLKEPKVSFSVGFSYNNYLGPALETGATVSVSLPIMESIKAEKYAAPSVGASLGAKLSSRSGLTFSPSLSASLAPTDGSVSTGIGLSTSYNSRTGIASLNLHAEQTKYYEQGRGHGDDYRSTKSATSISLGSSSISFSKPTYMPTLRMPLQNNYTSGQVELGGGAFGFRGSATLNGFYSESKVAPGLETIKKPLVGFMYSEKAVNNVDAVMDFNRVNDAEVTPNTPIISAPMYTYDIFSIQGEGTGGSIRAYRGDLGFMRDNETVSKDGNLAIGADIAPPGHYGVNVNTVSAPTRVGGWENNNNTLRQTMNFTAAQPSSSFENVYFRNPGETTVTSKEMVDRIGGDKLVRFALSGSSADPRIETKLELFSKQTTNSLGELSLLGADKLPGREKRMQVTTMLTAEDAANIGLEKVLRTYKTGASLFDATDNHIVYDSMPRVSDYRKKNHISEVDVLEQNGMRYVYGIPVYNKTQKDFTFSVDNLPDANNLVKYELTNTTTESALLDGSSKLDGYLETKETPAYASSFLITGLLSPDYVDVTCNGITEDDLGGAVKFNYTKSDGIHQWRTPRNNTSGNALTAHFNEGKRTEKRDNKATISYGEREAWYLNSIESKSMIAIFRTASRSDAKGVMSAEAGSANNSEDVNKRLDRIDLYTKSDIKANGIAGARATKSVLFEYSYALCKGTPDNDAGGKLTLTAISFAYNGQPRSNKERYVFNYGDLTSKKDNPDYGYNASDRWGTYKPAKDANNNALNPAGLNNIDYPYSLSENVSLANVKQVNDEFAGAWSLKKILLPSGGQMEIQYEADDYAYVQNRRACNMYAIYGLGTTTAATNDNGLYNKSGTDNLYVYIKLPKPLQNTDPVKRKAEIASKYLSTLEQLAFKLQINMPKGAEPLTTYATGWTDWGLCSNSKNKDIIYIKLADVDGRSPLAKSATGFLIENLTGQAFPGYDAAEVNTLPEFFGLMGSMLKSISNAFTNAENQVRGDALGRTIVLSKSFVRLASPTMVKYGGGSRVKRVLLRDNWDKMTGQYVSTYGQDYDYTTTEQINGVATTVSSGVASYEPAIGSEENPFREIVSFSNKLPLASAQYGAVEMPMLEAFYPSPVVGYSKVTVRSIHRNGTHGTSTLRSAIGKQVTEFYTARDYPSFSSYTTMNSMDYKKDPFFSFFNKEVINRRIISQGFLVETNDMHGKMKSQAAYSESDEKTPISATYHSYKNTGSNGLNDKVDFVFNKEGGAVHPGNIGIDMELMTDVREFSIESRGKNTMGQVDIFFFTFLAIPVPTVYPTKAYIENKYRAVTCTKLINYHAIEDKVTVMDKGSVISTRSIAYDAETGTSLVSETANEFNDPIYNTTYPAYWAYSGMAPAYENVGQYFAGVNFNDGVISISGLTSNDVSNIFESGDELYIISQANASTSCIPATPNVSKLWAFDKNKNITALTPVLRSLVFMDRDGQPYTNSNVSFRIVRSGKRNLLGNTVSTATTMSNPLSTGVLTIDANMKTVTATAVEYREKWQTDKDIIRKYKFVFDPQTCGMMAVEDCAGALEKSINPYTKGLIGNYKPNRSYVFYGSRAEQSTAPGSTAIRKNGYITDFGNYWNFDALSNLVPTSTNPKWVWNSELTKINSKGQELETKDALDRYTAAQYGFQKNLPVAMTQNARYGESFAEGFEDYNYAETLNNTAAYNCSNYKYIDFSDQGNIVTNGTSGVNSHSGRYMLMINPNAQASKSFRVQGEDFDNFPLFLHPAITQVLNDPGGNYSFGPPVNDALYFQPPTISFNQNAVNATLDFHPPSSHSYTASTSFDFYLVITEKKQYTFQMSLFPELQRDVATCQAFQNGISASIQDLDGNVVKNLNLNQDKTSNTNIFKTETATLCTGIYKIKGSFFQQYSNMVNPQDGYYSYFLTLPGTGIFYKSLSSQGGCAYTNAIASEDAMLNNSFALIPEKRMQFSAWVREDCGVPCFKLDYDKSNIEIWSGGVNIGDKTIKRTGNIIEGWQKVEGDFTIPAGATTAEIRFVNTNSAPMYVDDIRIHPFNANMKSYVYDPRTLRLAAELDENNYASFYEYDEEGQLVRVKKETIQGIKTINETRSAKQRSITDVQ